MDAKRQKAEGKVSLSDEELEKAVDALEVVQDELEKVEEKVSDEILKIEQKFKLERNPILEKRRNLVSKIPDFWTTVLTNHAIFFSCLTEEDHRVLEFLKEVDVEETPDIKTGHTISMKFLENPWFENDVLTKTYQFSDEGTVKVTGTTIRWKPGKDITQKSTAAKKPGKKRELEEDSEESFFKWFDTPEIEVADEELDDGIADLIRDEIWPNPLRFFTQEEEEEGEEGEEEEEEEGDEEDEGDEGGEEGEDGDGEEEEEA